MAPLADSRRAHAPFRRTHRICPDRACQCRPRPRRCDRVLEARLTGQQFKPDASFKPVARADARLTGVVVAKVAFDPRIARWIREEHPGGREDGQGRYVVAYRVADPAWFVREVLQYGDGAEVLEPESLREAVMRAVSHS